MREGIEQHARDAFDEDAWNALAAGMHYVSADPGSRAAPTSCGSV